MTDATPPELSGLVQALGRVPSGIFILTARLRDQSTGLLASWVQQAGFAPPMLTAALAHERPLNDWIAATKRFTLNQVGAGHKPLLRHFARGFPPDADAFEGLDLHGQAQGGPILAEALAYLDCEVVGALDSGDHRVYLARIVQGDVLDSQAHPMMHVRRNGLHY